MPVSQLRLDRDIVKYEETTEKCVLSKYFACVMTTLEIYSFVQMQWTARMLFMNQNYGI